MLIVFSVACLSLALSSYQNSLSNPFVKNFIEMQTDINVDKMIESLSSYCEWTFEGLTFEKLQSPGSPLCSSFTYYLEGSIQSVNRTALQYRKH